MSAFEESPARTEDRIGPGRLRRASVAPTALDDRTRLRIVCQARCALPGSAGLRPAPRRLVAAFPCLPWQGAVTRIVPPSRVTVAESLFVAWSSSFSLLISLLSANSKLKLELHANFEGRLPPPIASPSGALIAILCIAESFPKARGLPVQSQRLELDHSWHLQSRLSSCEPCFDHTRREPIVDYV